MMVTRGTSSLRGIKYSWEGLLEFPAVGLRAGTAQAVLRWRFGLPSLPARHS